MTVDRELVLRYVMELLMIFPASFMAIVPVRHYKRIPTKNIVVIFIIAMTVYIFGGALICSYYRFSSNTVLIPLMFLFYAVYSFCFKISFFKKLYCFLNASMLCGFSGLYTVFLVAPYEVNNDEKVFFLMSSVVGLLLIVGLTGCFFRMLAYELPDLFENKSSDKMWGLLSLAPLIMTVMCIWMVPNDLNIVMLGRIRTICLVALLIIPMAIWFLTHTQWELAKNMNRNAELQKSYDIVKMEEKNYINILKSLEDTRELRHNFRQHILVINEFANKGENEKLIEYLAPFVQAASNAPKRYFENHAINAVVAHYMEIAEKQDIRIFWSVNNVPEEIPYKEFDVCSIIGNLLENAVNAVLKLPPDMRKIHAGADLKNGSMLVIFVANPYAGTVEFDKNGFPIVLDENHGIGLKSIASTVKKYNGNICIDNSKNNEFEVEIMLMPM